MGIEEERVGRSDGDPSARAALEIEFRCAERHTVASFRESFLRWLNDRNGPIARALGAPDRLSLDEVPPEGGNQGIQTLRLRVSWPAGRSVAQAVALRSAAAPAVTDEDTLPATPSLVPPDHYVFFPDPPQAEVPLFRELTVPLSPSALHPSSGASRLRLERPQPAVLRQSMAFAGAVRAFVQRTARGVSMSRFTVRMPASPGAGRLALLGSAAVAAGFLAGTVYLTTAGRPGAAAGTAQLSVSPAQPAVVAAGLAAPPPAALVQPEVATATPSGEAVQRSADADHVERGTRPERTVVSAAAEGIPDTEVTPAPAPRPTARPVAVRRAGPVVVSARADAQASAVMVGGRRMLGALLVKSEPQGAEVSINGVVHGRTPLLIRGVGAGSRVVRLALPGYARWSWAVPVAGDKQTPVSVKLQPETRRSGEPID